jgi:hypothetical protein
MSDDNNTKLGQLLWTKERIEKQNKLREQLDLLLSPDDYSFLSFEESDEIQLAGDDWPNDKWISNLYIQTDVSDFAKIEKAIGSFARINDKQFLYVFFLKYNFGLIVMPNYIVIKYWAKLVEIDGDEIFLYHPGMNYFICVEITEDITVGEESKGRRWIFELTFSNEKIKNEVLLNI